MKLDVNFKKEIEPLINSSEALANWFEKNQEMMAYFEMTHPGCLHFENTNANYDVKVLGRMANGCLTWLESKIPYSDEDKVKYPSEEYLIKQLGDFDTIVIGGFHFADCVKRVAEYCYNQGIKLWWI